MKQPSDYSIKRSTAVVLQIVTVLIGAGILTALLWEPQFEGRNAQATLSEIYFHDPLLAYAYVASIPFFVALYKVTKLLGYASQSKLFSQAAGQAARTIKYCAFLTAAAIVAADVYIRIAAHSANDDPAGALMLGFIATVVAVAAGVGAAAFERALSGAAAAKSKND